MQKRTTRQRAQSKSSPPPSDAPNPEADAPPRLDWPVPWQRNLASLLIILHGSILLTVLSSNLAPSYLQGRVLDLLSPYLNMSHQAYNALPLELTSSEMIDFPLQVELQAETLIADATQPDWHPMSLDGPIDFDKPPAALRTTRWPNMARWLLLTASVDPESEVLADFAAQCVRLAEKQTGQRFQAVRFRSPKVLSYDEDLALLANLRDPNDQEFQPSVVYSANIVRLADELEGAQRLSLVPAQAPQRTAKPNVTRKVQP